jgi:hypothetical protein
MTDPPPVILESLRPREPSLKLEPPFGPSEGRRGRTSVVPDEQRPATPDSERKCRSFFVFLGRASTTDRWLRSQAPAPGARIRSLGDARTCPRTAPPPRETTYRRGCGLDRKETAPTATDQTPRLPWSAVDPSRIIMIHDATAGMRERALAPPLLPNVVSPPIAVPFTHRPRPGCF